MNRLSQAVVLAADFSRFTFFYPRSRSIFYTWHLKYDKSTVRATYVWVAEITVIVW